MRNPKSNFANRPVLAWQDETIAKKKIQSELHLSPYAATTEFFIDVNFKCQNDFRQIQYILISKNFILNCPFSALPADPGNHTSQTYVQYASNIGHCGKPPRRSSIRRCPTQLLR